MQEMLVLEVDGELPKLQTLVRRLQQRPGGKTAFVTVAEPITDKRLLGPVKMTNQVRQHLTGIIKRSPETLRGKLLAKILASGNSPVEEKRMSTATGLSGILNQGQSGALRFSAVVHGGRVQLWVRQGGGGV